MMVSTKKLAGWAGNALYQGRTFEGVEGDLSPQQKAAYSRWAKHYNYQTWQGYFTARQGVEWSDYSYLRKHSP